ncbi:hypothetical protein ILUMI_18035 [Ignelater luminosus]|uniref:Uncharacterized protein n=1 Tax=Ignelater luminosus TaxID=2038154 RepID=A0A8K0CPE1_IGNLU|nr:hypothetical protein ILUMI_18035 [Ignelater luminosus]
MERSLVNVTCADFEVLTVIFHFVSHSSSKLRWFWSLLDAIIGSWSVASIAVSSAKITICVSAVVSISAVMLGISTTQAHFLVVPLFVLDGSQFDLCHFDIKIFF